LTHASFIWLGTCIILKQEAIHVSGCCYYACLFTVLLFLRHIFDFAILAQNLGQNLCARQKCSHAWLHHMGHMHATAIHNGDEPTAECMMPKNVPLWHTLHFSAV
jgi:hypothetical protein